MPLTAGAWGLFFSFFSIVTGGLLLAPTPHVLPWEELVYTLG